LERRATDGEAWAEARKGRADAARVAGRQLAARALYRSLLAAPGDPGGPPRGRVPTEVAAAARSGIAAATVALGRLALFALSLGYLAGYLGLMLSAARPIGWRRLPLELRFYLPVAALFVAAALTESRAVAWATGIIAGGGALIVLASALAGLAPRPAQRRFPTARRLVHALATALAVLALTYAAIYQAHLADFVLETLRHGPER
jgi:hypothetical protein